MKNKINLYSFNKKIIYKVIVFHFIFISFLALHFKSFKQNKKNNLKINDIIESSKKKIIEKSPLKNINPKIITQKKSINSSPKKTISKTNNYENLINKLEKQIKDLDKKEITISNKQNLLIPKKIKELNINKIINENTKEETSSKLKEFLIKELQKNLKLPEYGEVKVSFMIYPTGEIKDIIILEYQSNENQKYLKNSLSELLFKSINKMFDEPQKFVVIFKNE